MKRKPVGQTIDDDLIHNVRYDSLHEIPTRHCPFLTSCSFISFSCALPLFKNSIETETKQTEITGQFRKTLEPDKSKIPIKSTLKEY
uniref:Uncharacterized protein n=1 Tax=Rhizophora mucronata TaxID=61149 RepID=A0A2P2L045_RHIMU